MNSKFKELIHLVTAGQDLSEVQAAVAMDLLMTGAATPAQAAAFLVALRLKGETTAEITGLARAMRARVTPVPHRQPLVVDTCGTGGDGAETFNISTTSAFVVAGAGVAVAKHGNRAASSQTGSADLLEALGIEIALEPDRVGRCIDEIGIGFLFAPALHPAMHHVASVRREIGVHTVFNVLGPLTNPAAAGAQLVGVFRPELTGPVAEVLGRLGVKRALVVHGLDGIDEISISAPTLVSEYIRGEVITYEIHPEALGLPFAPRTAIKGGNPHENALISLGVLQGKTGAARDVVLMNAAAALYAAGRVPDLRTGVEAAAQAVDSGSALMKYEGLRTQSRALAAQGPPVQRAN